MQLGIESKCHNTARPLTTVLYKSDALCFCFLYICPLSTSGQAIGALWIWNYLENCLSFNFFLVLTVSRKCWSQAQKVRQVTKNHNGMVVHALNLSTQDSQNYRETLCQKQRTKNNKSKQSKKNIK